MSECVQKVFIIEHPDGLLKCRHLKPGKKLIVEIVTILNYYRPAYFDHYQRVNYDARYKRLTLYIKADMKPDLGTGSMVKFYFKISSIFNRKYPEKYRWYFVFFLLLPIIKEYNIYLTSNLDNLKDFMDIVNWFTGLNPVMQALIGTLFTWFMTAAGAAGVFLARELTRKTLDAMLGFAAGVMIAASFWSLLAPAIEMSENGPLPTWVPAVVGFLGGAFFLRLIDRILPHLHIDMPISEAEGVQTQWHRTTLLVLAITLHNFPEGLAVGVAFGAIAADLPSASLAGAVALALGIGIQNLPEGLAVSMPLRREKISRLKSFWYGQLSGVVEPIAGVIGAALVIVAQPILPYALSFAAGAMIFVVIEELVPESQTGGHSHTATFGAILGFAVMMTLDVALG